ncbi:MAG: methylated-DNA--[protein]-cysteine S-methyltransferase [Candidatus Omnitrophica bacterium]|nr:methylated-DNA--[protein]-cysteine S-methyltransferase [Candidatus Omnitrophota bacterium]
MNIGRSIDIIIKRFTPFQKDVLRAACEIKPGETKTYKWIAERIGRPNAQRAVGTALKKNPLPLLIPCHRVVASGDKIGGYALGVELKNELLKFEKYLCTVPNRKRKIDK